MVEAILWYLNLCVKVDVARKRHQQAEDQSLGSGCHSGIERSLWKGYVVVKVESLPKMLGGPPRNRRTQLVLWIMT